METRTPRRTVGKQILEILQKEGKVKIEHTGSILVELHVSQGGVTDASVRITEKLK